MVVPWVGGMQNDDLGSVTVSGPHGTIYCSFINGDGHSRLYPLPPIYLLIYVIQQNPFCLYIILLSMLLIFTIDMINVIN